MILPPLPAKKMVGNMDAEFIEKRRNELETFLQLIAKHWFMKNDQMFLIFLSYDTAEF